MATKGYVHSEARGGGVPNQAGHDSALKAVTSKTTHLTQPSGGAKGVGDLSQRESTPTMTDKGQMAKVKKIAGGSNY